MRWAFGAGAVAAVSVITVGFVKPDFAPTEEAAPPVDQAATQAASARRPQVEINRKTRYVFLRPGERAPRGATVIDANELPRGAKSRKPAVARQVQNSRANASRPKPDRAPSNERPASKPASEPAPRPQQPPRTTTRQSG